MVVSSHKQNNKLPQPPAFIFLIDVSYNAVKSGMVSIVCQELKTLLDYLPRYAERQLLKGWMGENLQRLMTLRWSEPE